ncbi:hypothetical protein WJX79_000744 [Trebouxia sp. C0005]
MVPVVINTALQLPFQLINFALKKLRLTSALATAHHTFPVAGLDEGRAHAVLYALRQAAMDVQEEHTAELWLVALQLAQVASDRLLRDLHTVEANLEFWQNRLHQGSHLRFMLFGQGPLSFAHDVVSTLERKHKQRMTSATDKIERRVVVLRSLRSKLAEALAEVHSTASSLHLRVVRHEDGHGVLASSGGGNSHTEQLFQQARKAIIQTSNSCSDVFGSLSSGMEQVSRSSALPHQGSRDNLVQQAALRHTLRRGSKKMFQVQGLHDEPLAVMTNGDAPEVDYAEETSIQQAQAAVNKAQQVLHLSLPVGDPDAGPGVSANSALGTAASLANRAAPLIVLPEWVRMPSNAAQHWVRYTAMGLVSGWAAIFVYRHSRLSGSHDLDIWAKSGADSVREAYKEHLMGPIIAVKDELFKTFRQRRSIVSTEEFEADKSSLRRMLTDFEHDNAKLRQSAVVQPDVVPKTGPNGEELIMPGMEFMMECYEDELKRPIRNLVSGQLARSLLIQVQKLKVDTESAMLEIDQILKANELSIALVAAIPSFLIAGVSVVGFWRWLSPKPVDPRWEALPCRMGMVEMERTVAQLAEEGSAEMQGMFVYRLATVYSEAYQLFQKHDLISPHSEWPNVRQDLVELSGPLSVKQKLRITQRMMRVYTIFKF